MFLLLRGLVIVKADFETVTCLGVSAEAAQLTSETTVLLYITSYQQNMFCWYSIRPTKFCTAQLNELVHCVDLIMRLHDLQTF